MLFFVHVSVVALIVLVVHSQDSVCLWGRLSAINLLTALNGDWEYGGSWNSKPFYQKYDSTGTCYYGDDTLYLWATVSGTEWRISNKTGADTWYANCFSTADNPTDCGTNDWFVAGSPDANLDATFGACPAWNCDSVTSTVTGNNGVCAGPFDEYLAANTWRSSAGYVMRFNPSYFSWYCINGAQYDYLSCSAPYSGVIEQGWTELASGASVSLRYLFPDEADYTVTCVGTGSSNTDNPTASPVGSGSGPSDTSDPTRSPVTPAPLAADDTSDPTRSPVTPAPLAADDTHAPTASPVDNDDDDTTGTIGDDDDDDDNNTTGGTTTKKPSAAAIKASLLCSVSISIALGIIS